jgi:hypothetical protein
MSMMDELEEKIVYKKRDGFGLKNENWFYSF